MPKPAHWQQVTSIAGKRRINVPAKPTQYCCRWRLLGSCHFLNHQRRKYWTPVKEKLRELGKIVHSRKQSRMTGHATHPARGGIVDYASQHVVVFVKLSGSHLH